MGGDLDFPHLVVLMLEWEEVWQFVVCHHEVFVTFDDGEMERSGALLLECCSHQAVVVPRVDFVQAPVQVPDKFSHHYFQLPSSQIGKGAEAVGTGTARKRMLYLHLRLH